MARAQPVGDTEPAKPGDVLCALEQHCQSGESLANSLPSFASSLLWPHHRRCCCTSLACRCFRSTNYCAAPCNLCWLPHFCLAVEEVEVHIDTLALLGFLTTSRVTGPSFSITFCNTADVDEEESVNNNSCRELGSIFRKAFHGLAIV